MGLEVSVISSAGVVFAAHDVNAEDLTVLVAVGRGGDMAHTPTMWPLFLSPRRHVSRMRRVPSIEVV